MKIKVVVFNARLQPIVSGREEDNPQRWFRDRRIALIQMQHSISPQALDIDDILTAYYELSQFVEITMFGPAGILVISDDKDFLLWAKEQKFHTATLNNIDSIIRRILTIEFRKEV